MRQASISIVERSPTLVLGSCIINVNCVASTLSNVAYDRDEEPIPCIYLYDFKTWATLVLDNLVPGLL